jgi:hypothetical protein
MLDFLYSQSPMLPSTFSRHSFIRTSIDAFLLRDVSDLLIETFKDPDLNTIRFKDEKSFLDVPA